MKGGAGKAKGSAFERAVCKQLSLYLSRGERDDLMWRSALSGGRATVRLRDDIVTGNQAGDISAIAPGAFEFCDRYFVECKHYRALQIDRGFLCGTGSLIKFWRKAEFEASRYDKKPLLIARQNFLPTLLITGIQDQPFQNGLLITLHTWPAKVYSFDDATRIRRFGRLSRAG